MIVAPQAAGEDGFTLIELIIALALFSLISLAGVSLVQTVLGVERRSDGRLERLATLQRAMYVVSADFEQLTSGPRRAGDTIDLQRDGATGRQSIRYEVADGGLQRTVGDTSRIMVPNVSAVRWRFHQPSGEWREEPVLPGAPRPDAVELLVQLAPHDGAPGGTLRRLVLLPGEAK